MSLMHSTHLSHLIYSIISFIGFNYYKLIICLFINFHLNRNYVNTFPLQLIDHVSHTNPLNQYLREPEIVRIDKGKVTVLIYPFAKKDIMISNYYLIVETIVDQSQFNKSTNGNESISINTDEIDYSINYYYSVKKGLNYFAAVHLPGNVFGSHKFVTRVIGQHQVDLTKPREFHLSAYVNPLLACGREYRIGLAAQLYVPRNAKKKFIYVPCSRTIIDVNCKYQDIYQLFLWLSFIALLVSLSSFGLLFIYNLLETHNPCFWKRKKMNCQQLFHDNDNQKECLKLINHTNIYEDKDYKGDYDEMSISRTRIKSFKLDQKSNPIPISILFDYYNQMNNTKAFIKEFDDVIKGKLFNWKCATLKINQKKNRYFELLPYDQNRVVLKAFPNETEFIESEKFNIKTVPRDQIERIHLKPTCYINASWIDTLDNSGEKIEKKYIATQGPLRFTIADFWKMVYQTNCYQIVMLANVVEKDKIKCEKYWPDLNQTEIHGHLSCKCEREMINADYTIRIIRIQLIEEPNNNLVDNANLKKTKKHNSRLITQYHFTSWPDHYVPEYSDSVAFLLNSVRSHWSYRSNIEQKIVDESEKERVNKTKKEGFELKSRDNKLNPIIVHCSAGIGRSGVFMTIDSLIDQAIKVRDNNGDFDNLKLDVLKQFANIRKQRVYSVERINQYAFIHQILVELLCSKDIKDLRPKDYIEYYRMLRESPIEQKNDSKKQLKNISKLEEQFKILNKFEIRLDDEMRSVGLFNLRKNRNRQSIPKNKTRVLLPIVDNDYINAVYINGFRHAKEFIVTEVPLKEMRYAFWLMMLDQKVDTICLLNSIESHNVYWPTELNNPHVYKQLEIELMSEEKTTDYYVKRQFRINKKKVIYQLHYNHWDSICKRPSNIASYCLFMKAVQMHLNKNSLFSNQFVVQCLNGVSASGIYCISKHIVDRLFDDNFINIFLSCKYIKTNRMQFLENLEQYNFLYEYIELILKSFFSKDYNRMNFSMD